ncbi:MAG: metallophosphoesterase [Pirellulales bacterium]
MIRRAWVAVLLVLAVLALRPLMIVADPPADRDDSPLANAPVGQQEAPREGRHEHGHSHGHDGHEHAHDHNHAETAASAPKWPAAMMLPAIEGPKPWSDKPILDDPDRFHIAIMTDRTGGHRPGVWMKAVRRLNLMRPRFVMSVGDLIEGYSKDRQEVEGQWQEFLGFIDQMEMKFFFVAGNHDLTNPMMHDIWREHFGKEWYSFDYRGVHFLCLNSEDPEEHLGDEQLAWIEQDLHDHADARWTLVFFHKPLWLAAERARAAGNADPTNWGKVEELLGSRPHTVFAGHVHHYVQYDRKGAKYYHLATTGGASLLRGEPYGEFDHVAWLTMESDGPHIANLLLDGILPADAVTEQGIKRFRGFLAKTRLEVAPILIDQAEGFSEGRIELRLSNDFDTKVEMSGKIDGLPLRGLYVNPAELTLRAEPGQAAELAVNIRFAEQVEFDHLVGTLLTATLKTVEETPLLAERTVPVIIDRRFPCLAAPAEVAVDGNLQEWGDLPHATAEQPLVLGPAQQWQGPGDAALRFVLSHDDERLYFAGRVADDTLLTGDGLELRFDTRSSAARAANGGLNAKPFVFRLSAPDKSGKNALSVSGPRELADAKAVGLRSEDGYDLELSVPLAGLMAEQGPDWQTFQATAAIVDIDDANEKPVRVLWRGTPELDKRNINWGQFAR